MKKVAGTTASKPPVVIPVIVVTVTVDIRLIVKVPVERDIGLCELPSIALPLEYSRGCILFEIFKSTSNSHQVSSYEDYEQTLLLQACSQHHSGFLIMRDKLPEAVAADTDYLKISYQKF